MAKFIVRESDSLVFNMEGEEINAKDISWAKRAASRKQFFQNTNLRLEAANGSVISVKRTDGKWYDDFEY